MPEPRENQVAALVRELHAATRAEIAGVESQAGKNASAIAAMDGRLDAIERTIDRLVFTLGIIKWVSPFALVPVGTAVWWWIFHGGLVNVPVMP